GHPVPEPRREAWGAGFDDGMESLAHGAIRLRHPVDFREHGAFPIHLLLVRLHLLGALLHRGSSPVRPSFLAGPGGVLGALQRGSHEILSSPELKYLQEPLCESLLT